METWKAKTTKKELNGNDNQVCLECSLKQVHRWSHSNVDG